MIDFSAIDSAVGVVFQDRPAGSITTREYAEHRKCPYTTAQQALTRAVKENRLRIVAAMVYDTRGRLCLTNCYLPVEQKRIRKPKSKQEVLSCPQRTPKR